MDDTKQHSQWGQVDVCMCADLLGNTMRKHEGAILPNSIWKKTQTGHLTTPQHLCCTLVGLINSGFVGISLEKGERKTKFSLSIKIYWTPSESSSNASYWVKAFWNFPFHQNEPSLLLFSQNHWLDLSMITEVWSHDLVLKTVFPTTECSLEDRDISFIFLFWNDTQRLLWQTFTSVKLSWIPAICTVTSSVTLGRLLNILGPQLSAR